MKLVISFNMIGFALRGSSGSRIRISKYSSRAVNTAALVLCTVMYWGATPGANASSYAFVDLGTLNGGTESFGYSVNDVGQVAGVSLVAGDNYLHAVLWNASAPPTELAGLAGLGAKYHAGAVGINNIGQVVGFSSTADGVRRATLWNGATPIGLVAPNGEGASARSINDAGQIAGQYRLDDGSQHAVRWDGLTATDLGTLGGTYSGATGINAFGQVVGWSQTAGNGNQYATVWYDDTPTSLGAPNGMVESQGIGINDHGHVVGIARFSDDDLAHAAVWDGSTWSDLRSEGELQSVAYDINNSGQIVGYSELSIDGGLVATMWTGGKRTDLNSFLDLATLEAGWILTYAESINDIGWITGIAHNTISGEWHAYLLVVSNVPEPETFTLALVGAALLGLAVARRQRIATSLS